jgi:fzo-like conserved region
LVNEFDRPFSSEPEQIPLYKEALHQWIDERLGSHLQHRLHPALHRALDAFYREVNERVQSMVSTDEQKLAVTRTVPRSDFHVFYRLDCSNLCSHFREDIRFKFSLSIFSPWHHWIQHLPPRSLTDSGDDERSMKPISSVFTSKSWLLAFGIGGLVWCGLDWKIVASVASMYGGVYLYERLMWTRKAQERAFKRQYVDYVSSHMRRIVDFTAGNASAQVQRELTMYCNQILRHAQLEKDALVRRIQENKHGLDHLECLMAKGKKISKQGDKISHELDQFARRCL